MKFSEACGMIYERETDRELNIEEAIPAHNNIAAFHNCADRARAFGFRAEQAVQNFRTLAFVLSRLQKETDENKRKKLEDEKTETIYLMAEYPEDVALAEEGVTTYGWWRNEDATA